MNKIKVVRKSGVSQLILSGLKGQQLNENEVYAINSNKVVGLLHLDVVQKGSSFKLIYNITGFISFSEYLATPLNRERFGRILQNILKNMKSMEMAYFNERYLLMDMNRVFVNPATQQIFFVYVPIQFFESGTTLREFLLSIIQHSSFAPGEDTNYVQDYITILNNGINFSVFDLEEYIDTLLGKGSVVQKSVECIHCHTQLKKGTNYCYVCGTKVSGNTEMIGKRVYDPLKGQKEKDDIAEKPPAKEYSGKRNTQCLSDGASSLADDCGGTSVLGVEDLFVPQGTYLVRKKNGEKISVNKSSFRMGKKNCDYVIADNKAISRSHVDIIIRDERYYVKDLNSTNKTYIDGRVIPSEKEVEIQSGAKLILANEEFTFYVK